MMAAGPCGYLYGSGTLKTKCACPMGFVQQDRASDEHAKCQTCDHEIMFHESATQSPNIALNHGIGSVVSNTIPERVINFSSDHICPRHDTINKLIDLLREKSVVHVRGTPASGKTVLASLLHGALEKQGRLAYYLNGWETNLKDLMKFSSDPWVAFHTFLLQEFPSFTISSTPGKASVLIVDEAQMSYGDMIFWNRIIKEHMDGSAGFELQICLFCSYGSPRTAIERQDYGPTPRNFEQSQRVTLTPQSGVDSPQLGLYYTESEFNDVIIRMIRNKFTEPFTLDDDAKCYLYLLTSGQPGALESIMSYIYQQYRHALKHQELFLITEQHVVDCIERDEGVTFRYLTSRSVGRSFVPQYEVSADVSRVLSTIAAHQSIPWEKTQALQTCYNNGWVHRMVTNNDSEEIAVFPSRLHLKWIEYLVGDNRRRLPPHYTNLHNLCCDILARFSVINLQHSTEGKKLASAALPRPVEAQYQDEFYRVFCDVAGRGVPISSEWSGTSSGRVDFWIPEKKWAIELLRDYNRLEDHLRRFKNGGTYYNWLESRAVVDYIVINCATTRPTTAQANRDPKLVHAIFENDYKELQLVRHDGTLFGSAIRLAN
ncbi:hypothetical protein BDW42DRAFT_181882 [Aspergillus taichungensis]|uniref:Uncharacterized protein n=1 Tax=Aspergillus taichungensis TaxID=482145 RepID=A0A2J5HD41_9EURO|nr:hypothetical protein BDW42DRAFT_181882 [Aspergillus taichungensis]